MQILKNNQYAEGIEYKDNSGELKGFILDSSTESAKKIKEGFQFEADFENKTVIVSDKLTKEGEKRKSEKNIEASVVDIFKLIGSDTAKDSDYKSVMNILLLDYIKRNNIKVDALDNGYKN